MPMPLIANRGEKLCWRTLPQFCFTYKSAKNRSKANVVIPGILKMSNENSPLEIIPLGTIEKIRISLKLYY